MYYQDDGKHFGNRLREARLGAGLSQSELEELSGHPQGPTVSVRERSCRALDPDPCALGPALNVSEASLLGDQRGIMEDFFNVLHERGVTIASKEQGARLAQAVADMVQALGGIESVAGPAEGAPKRNVRSNGRFLGRRLGRAAARALPRRIPNSLGYQCTHNGIASVG